MDLEAVKVLVETQDKAFRTAMELVVDQLKPRLLVAEGTITEFIKSLKYTQEEVKDVKSEVKSLRKASIYNKTSTEALKLRIETWRKELTTKIITEGLIFESPGFKSILVVKHGKKLQKLYP